MQLITCISVCSSAYLSFCLSVCILKSVCLHVYSSVCLSVHLSICLFVYMCAYLSVMSICQCVHLSFCLSVNVSICLFVYLSALFLTLPLILESRMWSCDASKFCQKIFFTKSFQFFLPNFLPKFFLFSKSVHSDFLRRSVFCQFKLFVVKSKSVKSSLSFCKKNEF